MAEIDLFMWPPVSVYMLVVNFFLDTFASFFGSTFEIELDMDDELVSCESVEDLETSNEFEMLAVVM